jgi:hypothetical protein
MTSEWAETVERDDGMDDENYHIREVYANFGLAVYRPITDEGVVVGGTFDSDTAVGKCRLRTRAAGVLASR